jgi:hypothetical protein
MKPKYLLVVVILILALIGTASAGIFTIEDAQAAISIKTVSSTGLVSKEPIGENDLKTDTLQTVKLELSKLSKTSESKTVQMYPSAAIIVSSDFVGSTNVMQTSTKEGYPLLEVYYGYQKSRFEPWQYYFRIETIDKDKAYVICGDFNKKSVWLGTIQRSTYDTIISGGKIPDWMVIVDAAKI